eukprot:GAHX01003999.1.p1 GENE.GAHX01003999.1~~GAHX01003999.1.p1  ORF type:complete len:181 (-),score=27.18 GAHX01003999.1:129-671(-)
MKKLTKDRGIEHIFTSPYNPQCNGYSERINQGIGVTLRTNTNVQITDLPILIRRKLNLNINRSHGASPQELLDKHSYLDPIKRDLTDSIKENRLKRTNELEQEEIHRNKKRQPHDHRVGDLVYSKTHAPDKLEEKWKGPGKIIKVKETGQLIIQEDGDTYEQDIRNVARCRRGQDVVVSV